MAQGTLNVCLLAGVAVAAFVVPSQAGANVANLPDPTFTTVVSVDSASNTYSQPGSYSISGADGAATASVTAFPGTSLNTQASSGRSSEAGALTSALWY